MYIHITHNFLHRYVNVQRVSGQQIVDYLQLCMGEDPFNVQYDQHTMRKHLVESFESGFLIPCFKYCMYSHFSDRFSLTFAKREA